MSTQHFSEVHHADKTGKLVAWIIVLIVFIVAAVGLSWNESGKIEKKIVKSQAVIDSLQHEIEWRQKILTHHDSLAAIVADNATFRKLPFKTRQEISVELDKTTPKLTSTKHNIEVFEKLLKREEEHFADLQNNMIYKAYH